MSDGGEETEYEYGPGNRLTAVVRGEKREEYEYDADGNVTRAGARTYEYNAFGKLVKESDGKYEWEYSYRPSGQRYRKSRTGGGSEETEYNLWLGEKLLGGLNDEKKLAWVYTYGLEKL